MLLLWSDETKRVIICFTKAQISFKSASIYQNFNDGSAFVASLYDKKKFEFKGKTGISSVVVKNTNEYVQLLFKDSS